MEERRIEERRGDGSREDDRRGEKWRSRVVLEERRMEEERRIEERRGEGSLEGRGECRK